MQYNITKRHLGPDCTPPIALVNLTLESQRDALERDLEKIPAEPSADFRFADLPTQEWRENTLLLGMDFPLSWSTSTQKRKISLQLRGGIQNSDDLILSNGQDTPSIELPLGLSYPMQAKINLQHQRIPSVLDLFQGLDSIEVRTQL